MNTSNKSTLSLVQFDQKDILGLIELSESVGWDYDEPEISTVMSAGKVFGHKNAQGNIVSSAAIIPYETQMASIGMVIVNKEYRGLGLGKEATQQCIDSLTRDISIMLISTEDGRPLYERMGFITVDRVQKYICDTYSPSNKTNTTVTIGNFHASHFSEIVKLDEAAFGDKRSNFLKHRINQSEQCVVVKDKNESMIGFGLSILGPINLIIGPVVAPDAQIASIILDKLAVGHRGKLRIDIPSGHEAFMKALEQCGFVNVSNPPIMMLHSTNMPQRNNELFGIAAQVFG
ncbi:GNAT family N-acetyltransferase [Rossellomorea sp. SC111]|uniref:GNAT family N-acetyltransferase n=1 Tax=Rossellomorea sp. SC111 TaxID=2968985 RepID=UPI00215B6238|nr:GNAT family N-acetyltransferase [Rossellomorea sp. SC111]MCR8848427.1 GNAT family N-acetyltransferase [Rossellomorea sp. SC111]